MPSRFSMRAISRAASREWPPRSKKLSWTPTRSRPSTSAQISASTSSTGVRGATSPGAGPRSGLGRALRSTLPLGLSGMASRRMKAAGTMKSGNRSRSCRRNASSVAPPVV